MEMVSYLTSIGWEVAQGNITGMDLHDKMGGLDVDPLRGFE